MGDIFQSNGNSPFKTPSFFGDVSNSELDLPRNTASEEEAELNCTTHYNSDSFSDVEIVINKVFKWQREDADQQFWGDNELESTSPSDNDCSVIEHCARCRERQPQHGKFCSQCAMHLMETLKDQRPCLLKRRRKRRKDKCSVSSGIKMKKPLLLEGSINTPFTTHKLPDINVSSSTQCGLPKVQFSVTNYDYGSKIKKIKTLITTSSSSTESDSPKQKNSLPGIYTIQLGEARYSEQTSQLDENNNFINVEAELCSKCHLRPKNAIIVHGHTEHQCYCYWCTMKLWRANGKCPICHHKIQKVVKTITNRSQKSKTMLKDSSH